MARSGDNARLFARVDAVSGAPEVLGAPQPDFGKNDSIQIPQDEIDLAPATAVMGFDQSQALALQIARRDLLGTITGLHLAFIPLSSRVFERHTHAVAEHRLDRFALKRIASAVGDPAGHRSEERRVGKEWRCRWWRGR